MSGFSIKEHGLGFIFQCFQEYQGTWIYTVLAILALFFLVLHKKKKAAFLFGGYSLVLLLTVYNPFIMNSVIEKMDFEAEYYRFFWLLPINFLLSYVLVEGIVAAKKWWKKAAIAVLFLGSVLIGHKEVLLDVVDIHLPSNVYKVEDDLLMISELIHADSTEEQPTIALPLELNLQARQYDPALKLSIQRDKMLYWLGNRNVGTYSKDNKSYRYQSVIMEVIYGGQNIRARKLKTALKKTKTDYLVAYKAHAVHETILEAGCTAVGETPNTVIYLTAYGKKHKL